MTISQSVYTTNKTDDYLTMARIMGKEWEEHQRKEVWARKYTGHAEIAIKKAFETGFMAGFCLKFTGEES